MTAMGEVLRYRPRSERDESTAYVGMVIFLASWAMLFASLFFAYVYIRTRAGSWPPEGLSPLPRALPAVSTGVIAASSAVVTWALVEVKRANAARLPWLMLGAVVLGLSFLAVQSWLWAIVYASGLTPRSGGPYGSVFYGLTLLHALHVAVGLGGLAWVCVRAFRGAYHAARHLTVRLWAMYWHFVGIVWVLMFVSMFLL